MRYDLSLIGVQRRQLLNIRSDRSGAGQCKVTQVSNPWYKWKPSEVRSRWSWVSRQPDIITYADFDNDWLTGLGWRAAASSGSGARGAKQRETFCHTYDAK